LIRNDEKGLELIEACCSKVEERQIEIWCPQSGGAQQWWRTTTARSRSGSRTCEISHTWPGRRDADRRPLDLARCADFEARMRRFRRRARRRRWCRRRGTIVQNGRTRFAYVPRGIGFSTSRLVERTMDAVPAWGRFARTVSRWNIEARARRRLMPGRRAGLAGRRTWMRLTSLLANFWNYVGTS